MVTKIGVDANSDSAGGEEEGYYSDPDDEILDAPLRRYYTPAEVSIHNRDNDCWVSWLGKVYNLTALIAQFEEGILWTLVCLTFGDEGVKPIIAAAGTDISHWFDIDTGDIKKHKHPETGLEVYYTPQGRFIHAPPNFPSTDWRNDFGPAWWRDPTYCIGNLTKKTRKIRVINTLTQQEHLVEVCSEETIGEIQQRYSAYNKNAHSYDWKRLGKPLDMDKTLEENGIPDESQEFEYLNVEEGFYYPAVHLEFNSVKNFKNLNLQ